MDFGAYLCCVRHQNVSLLPPGTCSEDLPLICLAIQPVFSPPVPKAASRRQAIGDILSSDWNVVRRGRADSLPDPLFQVLQAIIDPERMYVSGTGIAQ